jgi:outer membrane lipase/esterase
MKKSMIASAVLAVLACGPVQAQQRSLPGPLFTGITFFGDSITDAGNIPRISGIWDDTPSPPYFDGRFSNGPVWADLLPADFGLDADAVRNVAVGGATWGETTISAVLGDNPAIADYGVSSQVRRMLESGVRFGPRDLVHLNAGNNDFGTVLVTRPPDEWAAATLAAADAAGASAREAIVALQGAGARQFLLQTTISVQGIPNFAIPEVLALDAPYRARLDSNLFAAVDALDDDGSIFYVLDTAGLFRDLLADPGKYGIRDIETPCYDFATGSVCNDAATRLWWDGQHPTAPVHALLAAAAADTLVAPRTLAAQAETGLDMLLAFQDRLGGTDAARSDVVGTRFALRAARQESTRAHDPFAIGYEARENSATATVEHRFGSAFAIGAALERFEGDTTLDGVVDGRGLGGFDRSGWRLGVTAGGRLGPLDYRASLAAGREDLDDIRRVTGVAEQVAVGATSARTVGARLRVGWPMSVGESTTVTPFAQLGFARIDVDGYEERGAVALSQRVQAVADERLQAALGTEAKTRVGGFDLTASAAWVGALDNDGFRVRSALSTVPAVIRNLPGVADEDHVRVSAAVARRFGDSVALSLQGSARVGGDLRDDWSLMLSLVWQP